jgi:hypothetical protein
MSLFARWFLSAFGLAPVVVACLVMPAAPCKEGAVLIGERYTRLSMCNPADR